MNSSAITPNVAAPLAEPTKAQLKRELHRAQRRKRLTAISLIAPLMIFLLVVFVAPIAILLKRAVENPEVADSLPATVIALKDWKRTGTPPDAAYGALAVDLAKARENNTAGALARRVNSEIPGTRSVLMKTARAMPLLDAAGQPLASPEIKQALIGIDEQWGQPEIWQVIAKNGSRYSPYYLLASMDMRQDGMGDLCDAASYRRN